jgi:hypothetical protein
MLAALRASCALYDPSRTGNQAAPASASVTAPAPASLLAAFKLACPAECALLQRVVDQCAEHCDDVGLFSRGAHWRKLMHSRDSLVLALQLFRLWVQSHQVLGCCAPVNTHTTMLFQLQQSFRSHSVARTLFARIVTIDPPPSPCPAYISLLLQAAPGADGIGSQAIDVSVGVSGRVAPVLATVEPIDLASIWTGERRTLSHCLF